MLKHGGCSAGDSRDRTQGQQPGDADRDLVGLLWQMPGVLVSVDTRMSDGAGTLQATAPGWWSQKW